jgi:hypothetical protein
MSVLPGIYKHYKDKLYLVIGGAVHSETREKMVVYVPLYDSGEGMVVRPERMWFESVTLPGGETVTRFQFVRET